MNGSAVDGAKTYTLAQMEHRSLADKTFAKPRTSQIKCYRKMESVRCYTSLRQSSSIISSSAEI